MDLSTNVRFDHELLAVEHEHDVACMLELVAPASPSHHERRPLALSLVVDRSGSMAGEKLAVTRRCAAFLVDRLAATDRLSVVAFDDDIQLCSPLVEVGPNRAQLHAAVANIGPGGMTNLSGGWLKGVETLAPIDGAVTRRVLLLTDGLANVGITDDGQLATMTRASAGDGIGTTTIGFGAGFSEDLLASMADAGGGGAHFAPTPEAAPAIFATEFDDLLSLVAQNVSVEVRPVVEHVTVLGILNDFPQVQVPGGVQVQLGDAYGDERRRIVFQLHIPRLATLGAEQVAEVVVRYVAVGDEVAMHEVHLPVVVNAVSAEEAAAAAPDAQVAEEVVILLAAKAQDEARDLADDGRFGEASARLDAAASRLRDVALSSERADELEAHASELEGHSAAIGADLYDRMSRKQMTYTNRERKMRRVRPAAPPSSSPSTPPE